MEELRKIESERIQREDELRKIESEQIQLEAKNQLALSKLSDQILTMKIATKVLSGQTVILSSRRLELIFKNLESVFTGPKGIELKKKFDKIQADQTNHNKWTCSCECPNCIKCDLRKEIAVLNNTRNFNGY